MDATKTMPKYKEFKIEWQSGFFDLQIEEVMKVTLDKVSFTRTHNNSLAPEEFSNDIKWSYKITDPNYEEKFEELCECFISSRMFKNKMHGYDLATLTITLTTFTKEVFTSTYFADLKSNDLKSLIRIIIKFIPLVSTLPYFISYEIETDDEIENENKTDKINETEDLPFDIKTVYFKDVDSKSTIVRKRPHMFELEYISKERPYWVKTVKDHSYEREYYFGEGNTCLFDISFDDVVKIFKEYGIPLRLLYEE